MSKNPAQDKPRLWERQVGESGAAWEAFRIYRDLGEKRTVAAVCEELSKSRQLISKWKTTWYWEDRVLAYDNELQKEAFKEAVRERREMNKRHIALSLRLQQAVMDALDNKNFSHMSDKDIANFVKISTELERSARAEYVSSYPSDTISDEQTDDVVIYVPDNGLEANPDE